MALRDGDLLSIAETSPRIENVITVAGAVVRPGYYAWQQGIRITDIIKSFWSDLHMTADLDYALVVRETNSAGDVKVLQFSLAEAVNQPSGLANIELKPRDLVLVFHHANQSIQRDKLNEYLRKVITERYNLAPDMQWTAADDLAGLAYQRMLESNSEKMAKASGAGKAATIGNQRIVDSQAQKTQQLQEEAYASQLQNLQQQTLSGVPGQQTAAIADTANIPVTDLGKDALPAIMQDVMTKAFRDKDIISLSASFTRTELLYPLMQKLKAQVRAGADPMVISVNGEVKVPGDYPLVEGASVAHLISAAGGLTESAFLNRAELTRAVMSTDSNGIEVQHVSVDLNQVYAGTLDLPLQHRDRLNIFPVPDWNIERAIEIRGEVKFPGRYAIQRGELLSDVINRAGGLTKSAFLNGVIYTREVIKERERLQIKKLAEQLRADVATKSLSDGAGRVAPQEAMKMIKQLEEQPPVGRLVIDLPAILAGQQEHDVQVQDGDLLYIPRSDNTISIVGEVQHAGSHRFDPAVGVDEYLKLAGGTRKRADEGRVYIIKADGSVALPRAGSWFMVNDNTLEAGDTIVVPVDTEYKDNLSLWSQITQVFYQSAVAIAALNSF
jgi:protein involved in polysaccharide export with SLBB domain